MTEFAETAMRKMCRNPRCGCKLPEPVSNSREAFCRSRGAIRSSTGRIVWSVRRRSYSPNAARG